MALVDGIRNPNSSLTFVRDDGTSFTSMSTPETEDYFSRIPRRQEQSAPLAANGAVGAPGAAPVASDAAPDMSGGSGGATGGTTKNLVMVPQGATGGPLASESPVAQTVSYAERSAVPVSTGNKAAADLVPNDGPAGGGGAAGGDVRAENLSIGDYARQKQIEAEMRGGGPAYVVKGGTLQTGQTEKTKSNGGKDPSSVLDMAESNREKAFADRDAAQAAAAYEGDVQGRMQFERFLQKGADDNLARKKKEAMDAFHADLESREREVNETVIDPGQFWADKSTASKIGFVLAAAFTGALNGAAGKQGNQVLDAVNKRIDEDINAQVRNLGTKKEGLTNIQRVYQQAKEKWGDEDFARNQAKIVALTAAEKLARQQASLTRGEAAAAAADKFYSDVANDKAKLVFNSQGTVDREVDKQFKVTQDRMAGGGGPNWKNIEAISARGAAAHPEAKPGAGPQVADFGGQKFDLGNMEPAEAAKARGKLSLINNFNNDVASLTKMRESATEILMPSAAQKAIQNRIAGTMSQLQDQGVLQGNEREEMQQILSNVRGGSEALAGMRAFAQRAGNQIVTQAGGRPIDQPRASAPVRRLPMADPVPAGAPTPQTQTMYRPDGAPVEVPIGQVASAVRSGGLTFAKGQVVPIAGLDGKIVPMSGADAVGFLKSRQSYGTNAASSGELMDQEDRKAFDTVGGVVGATAAGAARGVTLGLSDAAMAGLGGEGMRKQLQKAQKFAPVASGAGEVAGMLAPALFTGGASGGASAIGKAGRAATVVSRGATAAAETGGRIAERGVVGLGAAEGGRVAGAAKVLVQNAIEGGLQGAGQAVSDASLKGEPIEIEKILAHGGKAALLGAGLGGALHGTVGLAKAGVSKAGGAIKEGVTDAVGAAREKLVNKIAGAVEGDAAAAGARAEGAVVDAASGAPVAGLGDAKNQVREFLGSASKGDVAAMERQGNDFLAKRAAEQIGIDTTGKSTSELYGLIADKQSVSSLVGTSERAQKKLEKLTRDAHAMLPELIENDLRLAAGLKRGDTMSRELMAETAPKLKAAAGDQMEGILKKFDDAAAGDPTKLPSLRAAAERIDSEIVGPMLSEVQAVAGPGGARGLDGGTRKRVAEALEEFTATYRQTGEISHKDLHKVRKYLDEGINFNATSEADKVKSKAFRNARDVLDEELVKAGDRAQGLAGGESALEWQAAKNKWAASNVIAENAARGASKDSKNRVFGLSEQLGASRGGALGAAVGATLGSVVPVFGTAAGGLAGGLLGSHLGAYGAGMTRRYGDQVVSKIAREAGADGLLRSAMTETDRLLDAKLGTYLGGKGIQGAAAAKGKLGDLLEKASVESGQAAVKATEAGAKVDKAAVRAADAAERTATRTEEKVATEAEELAAQVEAAPPGAVRRALVEKLAAAKEAGAAKVQAIRDKATEIGEAAGRVRRALPGAPGLAVEADRVQKRVAESDEEQYQKTRQRYADLAQSPARIAEATASVRVARPDLANGLDGKLAEIVKYVNDRAPMPPRALSVLTPSAVKGSVSPSQRAEFARLARTAEDPLSIFGDLEAGRLTASQVRVVRDLYPGLHAELVSSVVERLADREEPLPYKQRLEIGLLLGAPTDASLEPAFISATQATFAQPAQMGGPPPRRADSAKPTGVAAATTKMQELGALELDNRPYEVVNVRFPRARNRFRWRQWCFGRYGRFVWCGDNAGDRAQRHAAPEKSGTGVPR